MTNLFECNTCHEMKPIIQFRPDNDYPRGYRYRCIVCEKKRVAEYESRPEVLERRAISRQNRRANDPERFKRPDKKVNKRPVDPIKDAARRKAREAIRFGRLHRPDNCTDCGKAALLDAHHDDYSKPLEVIFLCRQCHMKRHRVYGNPPLRPRSHNEKAHEGAGGTVGRTADTRRPRVSTSTGLDREGIGGLGR